MQTAAAHPYPTPVLYKRRMQGSCLTVFPGITAPKTGHPLPGHTLVKKNLRWLNTLWVPFR